MRSRGRSGCGPDPYLFHPEFLSGRATGYPEHVHWYNALASHRHGLPVLSAVVLLRPAADGPELTGEYEQAVPGWGQSLWFRYKVIRVWELPPERLLAAGLPVLPLAPVSQVSSEQLPGVLRAVAERLRNEAAPELKATLWAATEILLGLYHPNERVQELTKEVTTMILGIRGIEESSVYQDIFSKGEAKGRAPRARSRRRGRSCSAWAGRRWDNPTSGSWPWSPASTIPIASTACSTASSTSRPGRSCWPRPIPESRATEEGPAIRSGGEPPCEPTAASGSEGPRPPQCRSRSAWCGTAPIEGTTRPGTPRRAGGPGQARTSCGRDQAEAAGSLPSTQSPSSF